jgi:hypothetical protein
MGRYSQGFMTEVTKSLKLRWVSVVQRWLEGWMPRLPHLLKNYTVIDLSRHSARVIGRVIWCSKTLELIEKMGQERLKLRKDREG